MDITVRAAEPEDAEIVADLLRQSITEVCLPDHRGDPEILGRWLVNKTPTKVAQWFSSPHAQGLVAIAAQRMVGVGMLGRSGEILLLYVLPDVVGHGVGSRLLESLLALANKWRLVEVYLESTVTAAPFYLSNSFERTGELAGDGALPGYPMRRRIASTASPT